ncbi:hypothetical protein ACFQRL_04265 [Microbacterium fluvii]|uniref:Uncharacterized protein n=1 Tax=Microbacterium fluvii TaxID=415215 RepID=A0ABW2HA14_9MICO|nr:hypothetical protein [Microbacterium fluvii]MCU4671807.1 hypothetical protein [Microbacterium fluvii]
MTRMDGWVSHKLTREEVMPWIEAAQAARIDSYVFDRLPAPLEGSFFDKPELEQMMNWCAALIEAGLSHMLTWADYAVPLKSHPEAQIAHQLRPAFTLARASMECAAQALWILGAPDDPESGRRYLTLGIWDLDEQAKAATSAEQKADLRAERDACLKVLGLTLKTFPRPLYVSLIRSAADFVPDQETGESMTADRIERVWRTAAGAAHGKVWPHVEIASTESAEPSINAISEVLTVAKMMTSAAVLLYGMRCGLDEQLSELHQEGCVHVATTMTPIDGKTIRPEDVPDFR